MVKTQLDEAKAQTDNVLKSKVCIEYLNKFVLNI